MNRIKAVLFDMDGTITNTLDDLADATNYALSAFGFKTHETDAFRYFVGDGIPKLIERALPEENRDTETIFAVKDKFFEYYNVHSMDKTAAYPGVPEVVKEVMSLGYKTAVVTNKDEPAAKEILSKLYPDKSVTDLVFSSGFQSLATFYRVRDFRQKSRELAEHPKV